MQMSLSRIAFVVAMVTAVLSGPGSALAEFTAVGHEFRPSEHELRVEDDCKGPDGATVELTYGCEETTGCSVVHTLLRWVTKDGTVVAGPVAVKDVPRGKIRDLACSEDGTVVLVFEESFRFVTRDGPLGPIRPLCLESSCSLSRATVTATSDGFFLAWISGGDRAISGRFIHADGSARGATIELVIEAPPGAVARDAYFSFDLFDLAADREDHVVAVWRVIHHLPYRVEILAVEVDPDGQVSAPLVLNEFPYGNFDALRLRREGRQGFLAAWKNDDSQAGWIARRVTTELGSPTTTVTTTTTTLDPRAVDFLPALSLASVVGAEEESPSSGVALAGDGNGRWVSAWRDAGSNISSSDDDARRWSGPQFLGAAGAAVATDGSDGWVTAWEDGDGDIRYRRMVGDAVGWGADEELYGREYSYDWGGIDHLSLAAGGNGRWVAAWAESAQRGMSDEETGDYRKDVLCAVRVAVSADDAESWQPARTLEKVPCYSVSELRIATDRDGQWLVAWVGKGIMTVRSEDDAITWSKAVSTGFGRLPWPAPIGLAADGEGHWLMAFHREVPDGDESRTTARIFVARSDDAGATWSEPVGVAPWHTSRTGNDLSPAVAFVDGRWGIAWRTYSGVDGTGYDSDIVTAFSTDGGATWTEPRAVDREAGTDTRVDTSVEIFAAASGTWGVLWRATERGVSLVRFTRSRGGCGDGAIDRTEECDDGSTIDGDGCDRNCLRSGCGNGIVTADEACDDGNGDETDECLSDCSPPTCGDGFVRDAVEACDDGNAIDTDACLSDCTRPVCGDAVVHVGVEECDEGETDGSNGSCLPDCTLARCGDGFIHEVVEECDDGNLENGDRCTRRCRIDPVCPAAVSGGKLTASQALRVLRKAIGLPARCPLGECDIDGSGRITAADALQALRVSVGLAGPPCGERTILFRLVSAERLGSLLFRLDYDGAAGDIVAENGQPSCEVLAPSDLSALYLNAGSGYLNVGLVSLQGMQGPLDLVRCMFRAAPSADAEDLAIALSGASGVDFEEFEPAPRVEVILE